MACNAKVKIIPVFTVNLREAFRSVSLFKGWFRSFYDRTRLPIVPIYGGFPVKLSMIFRIPNVIFSFSNIFSIFTATIIGKPIEYDPNIAPEELAALTAKAIEDLIRDNQRLPGNIFKGVLDRFISSKKKQS